MSTMVNGMIKKNKSDIVLGICTLFQSWYHAALLLFHWFCFGLFPFLTLLVIIIIHYPIPSSTACYIEDGESMSLGYIVDPLL